MVDINLKIKDTDGQIRCIKCSKLLAKGHPLGNFEIKCTRCGALNIVFDQVTDQVIIVNPEGKVLYINEMVTKVTGFSASEAVGKKPSELWGNQMPKEFYRDMWRAIKEEKRAYQTTLINKDKNGKLYDVKLVVSPILDASGVILFYIGTESVIHKKT